VTNLGQVIVPPRRIYDPSDPNGEQHPADNHLRDGELHFGQSSRRATTRASSTENGQLRTSEHPLEYESLPPAAEQVMVRSG
jgi:hypothetical protein